MQTNLKLKNSLHVADKPRPDAYDISDELYSNEEHLKPANNVEIQVFLCPNSTCIYFIPVDESADSRVFVIIEYPPHKKNPIPFLFVVDYECI